MGGGGRGPARSSPSHPTSPGGRAGRSPAPTAERTRADGWVEVAIPFADEGPLAALILQFGPAGRGRSPPSLRAEIVRRLEAASVAERRRSVPKTSDRLGHMLVIVPYLVQHQGAELAEVATLFDLQPDQLRRDLDLLFMSGLPPYGPGDLIDVDVDEDDRIWITMADHFARPLRLTRSEALALYLRGTELVATPGLPEAPGPRKRPAHGSARALGPEALARGAMPGSRRRRRADACPSTSTCCGRRRVTHERLEIEYFAASTGAWSTSSRSTPRRSSRAWATGTWRPGTPTPTPSGSSVPTGSARRRARGSTSSPAGSQGAGRPLYTLGGDDVPVRLRLRPAGPLDRRVLRHRRSARARRRLARGDPARAPARAGSRGCCCGSGRTPTVVAPPELAEAVRELRRPHARPLPGLSAARPSTTGRGTGPHGVAPFGAERLKSRGARRR